jgi:N-acetylglucosamine kinase
MAPLILAVDGGQTGTRSLLATGNGTVLGGGAGGPIRHLFGSGGAEAQAAIETAIRSAFADARMEPGPVAAAVCGITGVGSGSPEAAKVELAVRSVATPERIEVVPDYMIGLLGASDGEPGVVVAAGGGSVAYGITADGREATAGGAGYLLGDEGSGFDIGRRALMAVIRAEDGRGAPTALREAVFGAFGAADLQDIKAATYAPDFQRDRIAALVPTVADLAERGDAIARHILRVAGEELACVAEAVIRRLWEPDETVAVYPTGGVFQAGPSLTGPFEMSLEANRPGAEIRQPAHEPLVGALYRALRLAGCKSSLPSVHIS